MDDTQRFDQRRYKHWIDDHVRFSDLDPLGHVNNNAIGQYFENARAALFVKVTPEWPKGDKFFVLARSAVDFRRELHMPAQAACRLRRYQRGPHLDDACECAVRGDDGIAYCESVSVWIDNRTRKPTEIPDDVRKICMEYAG